AGMAPGEPEESAPPAEEGLERLPASPLALEDRPDPELLLEEVAELDANGTLTRRGSPAAGKAKAEPRAEAKATPTPLSKFRTPEKPARKARVRRAAPAAKSASGGSEIGRIPLVRRRLGAEVSGKPGWLMRLLGSF
ncbi:MAG: hypothetical protein O7G30_03085, partial [Proteobacteria bacterium]|nr:hypothetical protein [Pseudomonadota bacterium]